MPDLLLAPSLLSADFARLAAELRAVEDAGADWHHVDVMDGHFVPNLTIGPPVVRAIRHAARRPLDVHLMIADPARFVRPFLDAGANIITFHVEAVRDPRPVLAAIRAGGARAGLVVKPGTAVEALWPFLDDVDLVLVMSVEPGFGGQRFMPEVLDKLTRLRAARPELDLEIDGGIDAATAPLAVGAGANVLVAGSAVYGAPDRRAALAALRASALKGLAPAAR